MHNGYRYTVDDSNYRLHKEWNNYCLYIGTICNCPIEIVEKYNEYKNHWVVEIIGHPVMIGDVLDYIEPYWKGYAQDVRFDRERKRKIDIALLQWDKKREPIEKQSDECIDYIYSLIKK